MLGAGLDEHGVALGELHRLALHLERAAALEDDVDLVVGVRLLPVGLGRDEHVDAELDPRRGVDDLVAAARREQPVLRSVHVDEVHGASLAA